MTINNVISQARGTADTVKGIVGGYDDRLGPAEYESPSGATHTFIYTELSRDIEHRVGSFEFAGVNGTVHQDNGLSGEVYPIRAIFSGAEYDIEADAFALSLGEIGAGYLTSPRWGRRRVQVISASQSEQFVSGMGEAIFEVRFQESLEREFPLTEIAAMFGVPAGLARFSAAFKLAANAVALADVNALKQKMLVSTAALNASLGGLLSSDDDKDAAFKTGIADIEDNIDDYVADPDAFAVVVLDLGLLPVTIPGIIDQKLQAYGVLLDTVSDRVPGEATTVQEKNSYAVDELIGSVSVAGLSGSINTALINTSAVTRSASGSATAVIPASSEGFTTRGEVLAAAIYLRDSAAELIVALDDGQSLFKLSTLADAYVQALENYDPLTAVAADVIRAALDLSFSLPSERIVVVQTDTTPANLCYEFYGNIEDATLDYFILTNELTRDNILLISRGANIRYYV